MDTKTRLLSVARERLRNMPELAAQFERDLDALTGARLLAEAGAMPEVFRQAEALGNPKAGQAIRTHLAGVVDRWAKAQPLPAQLPPLELQAAPLAAKAPKLATAADKPAPVAPLPTAEQQRNEGGGNAALFALARTEAQQVIEREAARDLFPPQSRIADEVAASLRKQGLFGADGKPLTGATIKRHALKGISSATKQALSTVRKRGK